ncbi:kinase-like domain-containing protein [Trichoderma compactum]
MATTTNVSSGDVPFATFSAANDAAILLLELIQATASPPNLVNDGDSIGFQIRLPSSIDGSNLSSSDTGSESSFNSDLRSNPFEWEIGAGTTPAMVGKGLGRKNPPILLCPPGETPGSRAVRKYIKDVHASLFIHSKSGVLMLKALCDRPIIYERGDMYGNDLKLGLDEWGEGMTCVLRRERNYINIGQYCFLLKFATQTRDTYRSVTAHMNENLKSEYHGLVPSRLFNFIPMASPYNKREWNVWLHRQIPTTDITAGVNIHTGQPVAIKTVRNSDIIHARQHIVSQLQMALQSNGRQESGVLGIIDVWCDHHTSPCLFDMHGRDLLAKCSHTHYSMPLASYNFLDLPWSKLRTKMRLFYFHQTLLGLAEIHEQDLAHGNIRPGSLLILSGTTHKIRLNAKTLATQKAVISLSMSRVEKKMFDATRICVAPEVWQNQEATRDLDKTKLDIWALASSWLYAFAKPNDSKIATENTHRWLQNQVDRTFRSNPDLVLFGNLLRKMLAWEPQDRPTAAEALASDAWQLVWAEKEKEKGKKEQKRKAKMQLDGAKRVRVLSPGEEDYKIFEL